MQPIRYKAQHQVVHWLVGVEGFKFIYSSALLLDAILESSLIGMGHRYPNFIDGETLARIGEEAGITRSPFHTDAEYAARLKQRHVLNKEKGSAERFIREIAGFFGASGQWDAIMVISGNGNRLSMQQGDGDIYEDLTSFTSGGWAKTTVVIVRDNPLTSDESSALRQTLREFKAAHIIGQCGLLGVPNNPEFYSEIPQLPAPMTPLSVYGVAGLYSESGEFHSSPISPVIFTF